MKLRLWLAKLALATSCVGFVPLTAAVLCVTGVGAWIGIIPALRDDVRQEKELFRQATVALAHPKTPVASPEPSLAQASLARFYDNLGEFRYVEQQLKTVFAVANKHNLSLNLGEYKRAYDKDGQFFTYQINLPVKGPYPAIRQFCEQILLAVPFASLDELSFKRASVGQMALEVNVRFTLYLAGEESFRHATAGAKESGFE